MNRYHASRRHRYRPYFSSRSSSDVADRFAYVLWGIVSEKWSLDATSNYVTQIERSSNGETFVVHITTEAAFGTQQQRYEELIEPRVIHKACTEHVDDKCVRFQITENEIKRAFIERFIEDKQETYDLFINYIRDSKWNGYSGGGAEEWLGDERTSHGMTRDFDMDAILPMLATLTIFGTPEIDSEYLERIGRSHQDDP